MGCPSVSFLQKHLLAIAATLTVVIILLLHVNVRTLTARNLQPKHFVADGFLHRTVNPAPRRSVLIVGQGRSGTSFVSTMLGASDEHGVFEVYEPLRNHYLTDAQKLEVLQAFLTCKFTPNTLWEKAYFPPFWYLKEQSYMVDYTENRACVIYRTGKRSCFPADALIQNFIERCKRKYATVVKELSTRIPGNSLSSLKPLLIDQTVGADIRLLHVVRDPRASINSRIKLRWLPEYDSPNFERKVQHYCDTILKNIEFGRALEAPLKDRYKLILYRDIAARPLDTARQIFKFAGVDFTEKTFRWITNMTNPENTTVIKEFSRPYSLVRDSEANIDKWRSESPPERSRIIERICHPLLELIKEIRFELEFL